MKVTNETAIAVVDAIMESWERQTRIVNNLCTRIGEEEKAHKPSDDGWPIHEQLCHIHEVRQGWLSDVSPEIAKTLGDTYIRNGDVWDPITDLDEIKRHVVASGEAVGRAVREHLEAGSGKVGPYSHPINFLEHMIWHDGWHVGLITLALRLAGKESSEEWEEANIWGVWRS